jgi:hypothetical protein
MRAIRHVPVVLVALGTVACTALLGDFSVGASGSSGGLDEAGAEGGGGEGGGAVGIMPTEAKIGIFRAQTFTAATDVTWSVMEGDAAGTVDAKGQFVSGGTPGVYHVVAASKANPTLTSTSTVTVVPLSISVLVGANGGQGNIDGPAARAHFNRPQSVVHLDNSSGGVGDQWYIADTGNNTIRHYDGKTGKVRTVAGKAGEAGTAAGMPTMARFNEPQQLAIDSGQKRLYVLDGKGTCIRMIDLAAGDLVRTIAGTCGVSGNSDGGFGMPAQLSSGRSMALSGDHKSYLYVCDGGSSIRRIDASTGVAQTMLSTSGCSLGVDYFSGGSMTKNVYYIDGSANTLRRFPESPVPVNAASIATVSSVPENSPNNLALSTGFAENNLYMGSPGKGVVYRYQIGQASFDMAPFTGVVDDRRVVNGDLMTARFNSPSGIEAVPEQSFLLVADESGPAIRRIRTGGQNMVDTPVGAAAMVDRVDGPREAARLTGPFSVATDDTGNIVYFGDFSFNGPVLNSTIRMYDRMAATVSTVAGKPTRPFDNTTPPVDGPKDQARFGLPMDMTFSNGKLYVIDNVGQAVREVTVATGAVRTIAGELGVAGSSDGIGAAAHFKFFDMTGSDASLVSGGIASDGTNLYVSDTSNHSIRKVVIATGATTTLAGGTAGSANGTGAAAQFMFPFGLAYADGMLYIADLRDHTIRRMDVATTAVTGFMGFSGQFGDVDGDASMAMLNSPARLITDGIGGLYVTELPLDQNQPAGLVRRIDLKSKTIKLFAGTVGATGLAAGPLPSTVNCPVSFALTPSKDLVFADFCEATVAIIQPL